MALNPSNIIVSRTGTTSETIFHIPLHKCTYTLVKRLSGWQILKVPFDSRGIDLYDDDDDDDDELFCGMVD